MQAPQGVELSLILMVCSRMCKCCAKIRGVFQNFTQKFGWRMPNLHISEPCQIYPRRDEQVDGSVCGDNMIVKFRSIKGHFKSIKKLFDQLERMFSEGIVRAALAGQTPTAPGVLLGWVAS
ncbi:uncharacterized protein LOC131246487 isoform X1 [Magnolia sinica]|uniref:uncharacterized protein LOC131246487 isoform X1 n=1 Tax=Magnolia sinica TaxID=86752 RepID=UPI002659BDF5|nr:uncharacterized protein LOC131246487 isoform X1 [Magnolia sinica]